MIIQFDQVKNLVVQQIYGPVSQRVSKLCFHSKRSCAGAVFFSMKGEHADGHHYIDEALDLGASVIVGCEERLMADLHRRFPQRTFICVADVRSAMACVAKHFFEDADESLKTVGVTGTNGKTTVAAYIRSLLTLLGMRTGSIGTTGIWSSKEKLVYKKSTPTTPESLDIYQILWEFRSFGDQAAAMEVTSIGMDQQRVEGIQFDVAVHTNFSEEHLEYHHTMEHYKMSKMRLFEQADTAVVNVDDQGMGKDLLQAFSGPVWTYSIEGHPEADICAEQIQQNENGSVFYLTVLGKSFFVNVPVYGTYNVANVLSAIGAALHLNFSIEDIVDVLPKLESPVGRFQMIQGSDNQKIILDYAHTPVALNRLLEEVKKLNYGRLIVMIAGIGIRDFNKMPKMAAAIEGKADTVIVTVDHPGFHDPQTIVDKVLSGFKEPGAQNIFTSLTRKEGVLRALSLARHNDLILLTSGCINEAQLVRGKEIPHSDEEIIKQFYKSRPQLKSD
ncbi:UDP-N-acetylmuramoyl-L-alanyl-D-glutamate--2,6-diaminopimelate ligase [Halobacillus salinarum]|uniref:UDP-N-acetylmuramyl-tripeptide synthetase n=1 Tax=Halobacillus salinarum TaxID=2932257 RepID=A0ABY4ELQ3_9BACI|nr:UDP-N-acetylmuramoyl-L-alanyl-D-glutamate--2,6-diaminopimelate ligase [Halobacillus salinarum]UOQ44522.1 UDP-N-acetylmuramoyl-L-alanyl-D-glutamate--2,6-diaminopimelate ligase [Halobacillus salinarum]